jgi:hypothetical protein
MMGRVATLCCERNNGISSPTVNYRNGHKSLQKVIEAVCCMLGRELGCALIKSTLGPGNPGGLGIRGGGGYKGAMGDKGDSLRATWD